MSSNSARFITEATTHKSALSGWLLAYRKNCINASWLLCSQAQAVSIIECSLHTAYVCLCLTSISIAANSESQHANPADTLYISIMTVKSMCLLLYLLLPCCVCWLFLCAARTCNKNTFGRRGRSLLQGQNDLLSWLAGMTPCGVQGNKATSWC